MDWSRLLNPNRRRQTTIPDDHRGQFERDFDRSIFSTPVKRLQDKAQVFPLEPHDAVRTRLTHSIEVSSIARGLAVRTAKWLRCKGEISDDMDRSIEAIAATCGLIHDLGNPPFGHAGEDAIRAWFERPPQACVLNSYRPISTSMTFFGSKETHSP
ncbi:MAG: HD domain-containing protein [Spirochaetaceae bacterium]|nr:HD domain-containing protein [Spirochaetaceae bacterium]